MDIIINLFISFLITIALIVVLCHGKIAHKISNSISKTC